MHGCLKLLANISTCQTIQQQAPEPCPNFLKHLPAALQVRRALCQQSRKQSRRIRGECFYHPVRFIAMLAGWQSQARRIAGTISVGFVHKPQLQLQQAETSSHTKRRPRPPRQPPLPQPDVSPTIFSIVSFDSRHGERRAAPHPAKAMCISSLVFHVCDSNLCIVMGELRDSLLAFPYPSLESEAITHRLGREVHAVSLAQRLTEEHKKMTEGKKKLTCRSAGAALHSSRAEPPSSNPAHQTSLDPSNDGCKKPVIPFSAPQHHLAQ